MALAPEPANVIALLKLARVALLQERTDEGWVLLQRALTLEPAHAEALALTGICWMIRGDIGQAVAALEKARTSNPALPMVHCNLGKAYARAGRTDAAEQALHEAIRLDPNHAEAWCELGELQVNLGRLAEGIQSLLRSIRANRRFLKPYLLIGSLYERAGKTDLMLRLYRSGLRHNPDALPLLERVASLYAARFEFRQAFAVAGEILKRRTLEGDYLRLGTYAVALGDLEAAEKAFRQVLLRKPKSWQAHYNLAELYMSAQLMDQARQHYAAAMECGPAEYEPLNGMGLLVLSVDRNPARAIDLLQQAVAVAPSRAEARFNLALAHAAFGDLNAAQDAVKTVLAHTQAGDALRREAKRLQAQLSLQVRSFRSLS